MSDALSGFIQNYALAASVLAAVVIIFVTYIVQRWVFSLINRLSNSDKTPLPGGSILANIARIIIWLLGLAILSKVCFNYDLTAFVTALGVGGIAISLGFQDTLLNLIGGLQVSLGKIVELGEYIEVLGQRGRVVDIGWRHTTIIDSSGSLHSIPNSLMNKNAIASIGEEGVVSVPFLLAIESDLDAFSNRAVEAARHALGHAIGDKGVSVLMRGEEVGGLAGDITVHYKRSRITSSDAADKVLRAIVPVLTEYADESQGYQHVQSSDNKPQG